MSENLPKPPTTGWKYWVNNFLSLIVAGVFMWLWWRKDNQYELLAEKFNTHLQNDANAQSAVNFRIMERQFNSQSDPTGYGVRTDSTWDTTKRAGN